MRLEVFSNLVMLWGGDHCGTIMVVSRGFASQPAVGWRGSHGSAELPRSFSLPRGAAHTTIKAAWQGPVLAQAGLAAAMETP